MKKLTSYLFAFIASVCMSVAYAQDPITIYIDVDDSTVVRSAYDYSQGDIYFKNGLNEVQVGYDSYYETYYIDLFVSANGGRHTEIDTIKSSSQTAKQFEQDENGTWYLELDASCAGVTYTIETVAHGTDSVLIITDDYSKVSASCGAGTVSLSSDTTVAWFSTDTEKFHDLPFTFGGKFSYVTYSYTELYKVLLNGAEVKDVNSYGEFSVTPAKGDTIKVFANAPADLWYPVFLNFKNDTARASVTKVTVNDAVVDITGKDSIHVGWNANVKLYFDQDNYNPKVNGSSISSTYYGYHEVSGIKDTVKLEITAEKYKDLNFTVISHKITCFGVSQKSGWSYVDFEIAEGSKAFTINSKSPIVFIKAKTDCEIDSIKVDGVLTKETSITVTEGMEIEVWADSIVYQDIHFTVVAHNANCFELQSVPGYAVINLKEGNNSMILSNKYTGLYVDEGKDCKIDSILVNGEKSAYQSIKFAEGSVIEIFADSIRRNSTFMLFVDNAGNYSPYYQNVYRGDYTKIVDYNNPLVTGYKSFKFDPSIDNSFDFYIYDNDGYDVIYYLNDVPEWGYSGWSADLADKDVVKIFATEQTPLAVTFAGDQVSTVMNVTKDRIVAVDDITLPLSVLPGTEVAFTTSETVTVNGVAHEAVDGVHTVVVTEATTIVVGVEPGTGLNAATTAVMAVKQLREGQIVIIKNGVEYNVLGAEIR